MASRLEFRALGPLEVLRGGAPIDLGPHKQRSLLALLLVNANTVVSTDRIVDALWGDAAVDRENALWTYVSRLRSALEPDRTARGESSVILTKEPGYVLTVDPDDVDVLQFEQRLTEARDTIDADPERALRLLEGGLELWRGDALADFTYEAFARDEIIRLEELRHETRELVFEAKLAVGDTRGVVTGLEAFVREQPHRERPVAQLMVALYRNGRQAEALRAFERHRRGLIEELGIDPSPELRRLEEQILLHDDRLRPARHDWSPVSVAGHQPNPYKGLHAFTASDESAFFGRERLVAELLRRIERGERLVAVVGPSGSGKSSAVRAGLIPRIRKATLPGTGEWVIADMVPGAHPFSELEAALVRARLDSPEVSPTGLGTGDTAILRAALRALPSGDSRLVLVVDQFEELFTLVEDRDLQRRFLEALLVAIDDPHGRITVVATLRADFYDRPLLHPEFGPRLGEAVVNVTPMTLTELEEAAARPAAIAGVEMAPGLIARLIAEVAAEPGALPMFQYTLTELFERRSGDTLLESEYELMGGLRGAIAHRAEELYSSLHPEEQAAARQLFLRLVTMADDETWSRRRVRAAEIISLDVDVATLQSVIDRFGAHRLLLFDRDKVTGSPTVEVGHEALLTEWPRLAEWIRRARQDLSRHAALVAAVDEWEREGRAAGYLASGARLAQYESGAASSAIELNARELEFLGASAERRDAQLKSEHDRASREEKLAGRARRRLWALAATLVALAATVIGVLTVANGSAAMVALIQTEASVGGDLALLGLREAERRYDVEVDVITPPWTSVADVQRTLAEGGVDLIVIDGALDSFVAEGLALDYPETRFAVFHRWVDPAPPNYVGYVFADGDAAYLAGVAAAMESNTGTLGVVGAYRVNVVEDRVIGFELGARSIDPDAEILVRYLGPAPRDLVPGEGTELFNRPDLGRASALELYGLGADVVFHAAGDSGLGVIQAAREASASSGTHVWAIGADSDQYHDVTATEADHVLMSTIRRYDEAVLDAVQMVVDEQFDSGTRLLTLRNDGVGYVTTGGHVATPTIDALERAREAIVEGTVVVTDFIQSDPPAPTLGPCGPDETDYRLVAGCGVLTAAGTPRDIPPLRLDAGDGTLRGFEVELLDAIAERLGLEVEFVATPFANLISSVAAGVYDLAMNRLDVTPEREDLVAFTSPHLRNPTVVVVNADSDIATLSDAGSVIVGRGSSFEDLMRSAEMRSEYPDLELVVESPAFLRSAIEEGTVDAWVTQLIPGLEEEADLEIVEEISQLFTAFAVHPGHTELVTDMNGALAEMIADGSYSRLYEAWFSDTRFRIDRP